MLILFSKAFQILLKSEKQTNHRIPPQSRPDLRLIPTKLQRKGTKK